MHTAAPICHFFQLPREIREFMYSAYVTVPGGYEYDAERDKLIQADGGRVDLQLARTCRTINQEIKGLAMQNNKITFRSFAPPDSDAGAGVLHAALHRIERAMWYKLCMLGPNFITESVQAAINSEFPQFNFVVIGLIRVRDGWDTQTTFNENGSNPWGETPSVYRDFLQRLFALVSEHPDWALRSEKCRKYSGLERDFLSPLPEPWPVLKVDEVDRIKYLPNPGDDWSEFAFTSPSNKHAISAAALAVNFFASAFKDARSSVREIELIEDHAAVAYPECHMRGLSPCAKRTPSCAYEE